MNSKEEKDGGQISSTAQENLFLDAELSRTKPVYPHERILVLTQLPALTRTADIKRRLMAGTENGYTFSELKQTLKKFCQFNRFSPRLMDVTRTLTDSQSISQIASR